MSVVRVASLLLFVAACSDASELAWRVTFPSDEARAEADVVEVEIRRGGCMGQPVFRAEITREGDGPAPPTLAAGAYGFAASARSDACGTFAATCTELSVPREGSVELALQPVATCAPVDAGLDATLDATPADATLDAIADGDAITEPDARIDADASIPDATPDAAPDPPDGDADVPDASPAPICMKGDRLPPRNATYSFNTCTENDYIEVYCGGVHPPPKPESILLLSVTEDLRCSVTFTDGPEPYRSFINVMFHRTYPCEMGTYTACSDFYEGLALDLGPGDYWIAVERSDAACGPFGVAIDCRP